MSDSLGVTITTADVDGAVELAVSGELDLVSEHDLIRAVQAAAADGRRIVIDLTGVAFMDSSGLRALLVCRDRCKLADQELVLRVTDGPVRRLLQITGVAPLFQYA